MTLFIKQSNWKLLILKQIAAFLPTLAQMDLKTQRHIFKKIYAKYGRANACD